MQNLKMDSKLCVQITLWLCSIYCLNVVVAQKASTSVPVPAMDKTTPKISLQLEYTKSCYVEWFKVSDLITRMNQTVRIFNHPDDHRIQCQVNPIQVDVKDREACTEDQISQIHEDLAQVASELFRFVSTSEKPSESDVFALDKKKQQLIESLEALRVFYGPSPCGSSSIALFPFRPLVDHLDSSLDRVLKLVTPVKKSPRSTAEGTTATPPATKTVDQMLSAVKAYNKLLNFARVSPEAMTAVLPEIVEQLFSEHVSNFDTVMKFIDDLPLAEKNKSVGYQVLFEALRRNSLSPSLPKLVELADKMNRHKDTSEALEATALVDVANYLSPLVLIGEEAECDITSVAYPNQQLVTRDLGWPESTYLSSETSKATWDFKLAGFMNQQLTFRLNRLNGAVYASDTNSNSHPNDTIYQVKSSERYILRDEEAPAGVEIDWILAPVTGNSSNRFRILTAQSHDFVFAHETATRGSTLRRVLLAKRDFESHDYIPEADQWILNCRRSSKLKVGKSIDELLSLARHDPEAATAALPKLVPQMYAGNASRFSHVVRFIKDLPSVENKIVGYSTLYQEIFKHVNMPSASELVSVADEVNEIEESFAATQEMLRRVVYELNPLILIGDKSECNITNVAYPQQLITADKGWPESAYLRPNLTSKVWEISPSVVTGLVTFQLKFLKGVIYVSDTNTNNHTDDTIHQLAKWERYVLRGSKNPTDPQAEVHWRLVPVQNEEGGNQFRILTAKYNEVMFAHDSAKGAESLISYRRVLVKNGLVSHKRTSNGSDLWKLDCRRSK